MSRTIGKWGNSLALRMPKAFTAQLHWDENTEVAAQPAGRAAGCRELLEKLGAELRKQA